MSFNGVAIAALDPSTIGALMREWFRRHNTPGNRLDALVILAVIFITRLGVAPVAASSPTALITGGDTGRTWRCRPT